MLPSDSSACSWTSNHGSIADRMARVDIPTRTAVISWCGGAGMIADYKLLRDQCSTYTKYNLR